MYANALNTEFSTAPVILAGDFNTLDDTDVISRTTLKSIVDQPTRGVSSLDRVYVSDLCDLSVKVVESAVRSDHKAVVANTGPPLRTVSKRRERRVFRRRSPARYAEFLQHISQLAITLPDNASPQTSFDDMYTRRIGVGPPAPTGHRFWQTLTFTVTLTWFSKVPTYVRLPPNRCSQWHQDYRYLDQLKRSR